MQIARKLKTDKRTKIKINATVLKTRVHLEFGNLSLSLSKVEAQRIAYVLDKAVAIQETVRHE